MTYSITKISIYSFILLIGIVLFTSLKTKQKALVNTAISNAPVQPEELGKVNWFRDFEEAIALGKNTQKPILILFQEVPGCATCRNYGNNILSHPLLVEAMETAFIPLAIYNNKGGEDRKVLDYFGEPSWNNPVVRIINADKKDIVKRIGGDYSALGLVNAMIQAMNLNGDVIPEYLRLWQQELTAQKTGIETATVGMYCFWTGEKEIGKLDGVIHTQPGFMGGREVVEVAYNPDVIAYHDLLKKASAARCADHVYVENKVQSNEASNTLGSQKVSSSSSFRMDAEPKYYLSKTHYKYVPMTLSQQTKANALVGQRKSPKAILSPKQIAFANFVAKNKGLDLEEAINVEMEKAWQKVERYIP